MNLGMQLENAETFERGKAALEKAKKHEHKKISQGHRYVTINERTKVLVECDATGKPTEKGEYQIYAVKRSLGIVE